jgi:hypothetical protein
MLLLGIFILLFMLFWSNRILEEKIGKIEEEVQILKLALEHG